MEEVLFAPDSLGVPLDDSDSSVIPCVTSLSVSWGLFIVVGGFVVFLAVFFLKVFRVVSTRALIAGSRVSVGMSFCIRLAIVTVRPVSRSFRAAEFSVITGSSSG